MDRPDLDHENLAPLLGLPAVPADVIVVGAMSEETTPLIALADESREPRMFGGVEVTPALFGATSALVVRSGIGLANAASAATIGLLAAGPRPVLAVGSAGGIGDIRVGDIAIGAHYQYSKADARGFGYALGQVPQMPPVFDGEPRLAGVARTAAGRAGMTAREGLVLSSDVFVTSDEAVAILAAFPEALSVDMESTAIAQVCHRFGAPFCSIRAISDLCGPEAGTDFDRHIDDASDRSAACACELIAAL